MSQTELHNSDTKMLREFGFVMAGAIAGVFGILLPWLFDRAWPLWPWPIALLFLIAGLFFPASLRLIF